MEDIPEVSELDVPMVDGTRLRACRWRPPGAGTGERFPVLLWADPYAGRCTLREPFVSYARAGYVVVYTQLRGTGLSEGTFPDREYSERELDDAIHTIDWLARQEWSTGAVGMFGESWSGYNALQVAMRHPPALRAIVASVATEDLYHEDIRFTDGILVVSDWTAVADILLIDVPPPGDPFDEAILEQRFEREPWSLLYLRQQRDGRFWRNDHRLGAAPDLLRVPTMMVGGWYDGGRSAIFRALKTVKSPFRAIVGPWNHSMRHPAPQADLIVETVEWWDAWLKDPRPEEAGRDAPEPARLVAYLRRPYPPGPGTAARPGEWRRVDSWPPDGFRELELYPTVDGGLAVAPGRGDSHRLRYRPEGGIEAGVWWGDPMPDQRPADAYSLVYESEPLADEIQILGRPQATLRVSTTAPHANWMVRLSDVAPDGTTALVTGGAVNGTHRRSDSEPGPLVPGETVTLDVALHFTSWIFEPGHRVRISVSNALWPMFWPTPHPMTTTLEVGGDLGSRFVLPTVPPATAAHALAAAAAVGSVNLSVEEAGLVPDADPDSWFGPARIERDELAGVTTVSYDEGPIDNRSTAQYQVWDADPAHVRFLGTAVTRRQWRDQRVELRGETEIVSDAMTFHYRHTRQLLRAGVVVRERRWEEEIARDFQ